MTKQVYYYASGVAKEMTFYAAEEGLYKIYSTDEKLVVARLYRQHTNEVNVTGIVTAPAELSDYEIMFTNRQTKEVLTTQVTEGKYQINLNENYDYDISLNGAEGYMIASDNVLSVTAGATELSFDVSISDVSLVELTGTIKGLPESLLNSLSLSFQSDSVYVPDIEIGTDGSYTLSLEKGVVYHIAATGVNDYSLLGDSTITATEDGTYDFEFNEKEKFPVSLSFAGIEESVIQKGEITFTNINEAGYAYTYEATDKEIALRNGQYKISMKGMGESAISMEPTSDGIVSGSAISKTITFSPISNWNFAVYNSDYSGPGIETIDGGKYYLGLQLSNTGVVENKGYLLLSNGGTVGVPAKAGDIVTVNYCYSAAFQFEGDTSTLVDEKSGNTSQIDSITYTAKEDGMVSIEGVTGTNSQTYVTSIQVTTPITYKSSVSVGTTGCDYTSIQEALAAIKTMIRPNNERVTIQIQPGNYEEMLVIDVPNITLENASNNPSIELSNKGVDIEKEAVRITSYYGHGYSYYSMNNYGKYDSDTLEINKANGYLSYVNPGTGTTNGSYWNATVVISSSGFEAKGIIFENSYNQYISQKEANDIVVEAAGSKGVRPTTYGDTSVQNKSFVERAAALAITDNVSEVSFNNCRFVGRQDTLYGGKGSVVSFYKCAVMGACDYIFGGMTAVFYKCKLVMNTSETSTDIAYITAAQQTEGRGYLMYNCTVTSATPGSETASEKESKPGYFGRPWQAVTSEVVFYKTIVEATDFSGQLESMIVPLGWLNTLSGESQKMYEFGTMECLKGTDNSANRATWSTVLTEAKLSDGTDISTPEKAIAAFLGNYQPFTPEETDDTAIIVTPTPTEQPTTTISLIADQLTEGTFISDIENNGFTIKATAEKSVAIDGSSKSADDGTNFTKRIKLGGTGAIDARSIHFSATGKGTVKVYAMSSSAGADRDFSLYKLEKATDGTTTSVLINSVKAYGATLALGTIDFTEAGDYYLASPASGVNVYGIEVTMEGEVTEPDREDWSNVTAPTITSVVQNGSKIIVTFELKTGDDGADKATVQRMDISGNVIDTVAVGKDEDTSVRTAEFLPTASGIYTFKVIAERVEETTVKESAVSEAFTYVLPLATPVIKGVNNQGNGSVKVSWNAVTEAESYNISYQAEGDTEFRTISTTETSTMITGLSIGLTYTFRVQAKRNSEVSSAAEITAKVTEEEQRAWYFSAFGQGVNTTNNYYSGDANEGSVTIASEEGKGKLVPASTDGLAFYYTTIDPENENFILSAKVTVDSWKYSNGQEGFGLMAADAVGEHGNSAVFWNNSYMNSVTKVEYLWDSAKQQVSDSGDKISMKLGIGAQQKIGVTAANIADGTISTNINELFHSSMTTIETSCATKGAGTYNIVGNYSNAETPTGTVDAAELKTTFLLTIKRDNTGYRLSYTDEAGNTTTKLFYDLSRDSLTQIDKDNIYVGFYASRNAKITVTDINLQTSNPATDAPAENQEITYVTPSYRVISGTTSGVEDYELTFLANADGVVTIKDSNNNVIAEKESVTANTYVKKNVILSKGENKFTVEFTPNADYKPSEYELLSSYDTVTFEHSVLYKDYDRQVLYVSPDGKASGTGSKVSPLDIYTAIKYVKPGQMIVLAGGTYSLTSTVKVERGISGTAEKMIYLLADPSSSERPIFNFNQACAGMVFAGDYWYMQGFDVTGSEDAQKGLQLSGDHCVLDQVNAYYNGSTGIQISRYLSTDNYEDWPSNNLVLNCTSYGNADKGYEDADGFAAKLTVGDGNVFDGCMAYNNADDGWDLFAKIESGPIGKVVIRNSVAYGNGYLPDGTNAGNGNGFKLGGSSISGYHVLENSIAFNNKAKGIDSNSCPDIQIYDCTTFNNGSYNVAFYTNDAANTDYLADGVLSYRTLHMEVGENIKAKGTQDVSKIYGKTNYFWDTTTNCSFNTETSAVEKEWFVNLDTDTKLTRNSDGTIQMNGLLTLTDKAPVDTGARLAGSASMVIVIPKEDSEVVTPTPSLTPTPSSTPVPTSAPTNNDKDKDTKNNDIPKETNNSLNITLLKDIDGNMDWNSTITNIKKKMEKAYGDTSNNNDKKEKLLYITLNMNGSTQIPKELLEAIEGHNLLITLDLGDGVKWQVLGTDIVEEKMESVDLAVNLDTDTVPAALIETLLSTNTKQAMKYQISLVHEGILPFKAELSIDFNEILTQLKEELKFASILDMEHLLASMFYYNSIKNTLELQSSCEINQDGLAIFTMNHASDYVIFFSNEFMVDENTLTEITVNGMSAGNTDIMNLYIGGTVDKKKQLEIVLPDSLKDAIDKELIPYKVTYTTSDKSVAAVLRDGTINGVSKGKATITTQIVVSDVTLIFKTEVSVEKAHIEFVKTVKKVGVKEKVTYKVAVYGFAKKDILWSTSKKGVAIVAKNSGKTKVVVTGKNRGSEYVIVKVLKKDGKYLTIKSKITVTEVNDTKDNKSKTTIG